MDIEQGNGDNGARRMRRRSEWALEVAGWRESGKPAREYAASRGLNPKSLKWWATRLKRSDEGAATTSPAAFVPVRVVPQVPRGVPIEIALGNGRVVRVAEGCDLRLLAQVLEVVAGGAR